MKNLTDIIYQYKNHSFSYPEGFDCAIFSAKVVQEFTGKDIPNIEEIITYRTYKDALKTIKDLGCKDLSEVPSVVLNKPKKDISEVKLGDIVYYINEEDRGILGVCNGCRSYFLQKGGGLTARNTKDCKYCWSTD
jgi:hypothetical protein